MKTETITRIKIVADKGKVLTDGTVYGNEIYLAEGMSADKFHEITDEEYWRLMAESEEMPE